MSFWNMVETLLFDSSNFFILLVTIMCQMWPGFTGCFILLQSLFFFFPHNWLFISAMCVYYPAGLLFSSFLYDLFLQSIFLASCERHLMELMTDSAAWSVLHGGLVIQFGSKTHSGTFTTAVIHQLIPLWLQSKVLSVVWGIFRAVFGSRQFPLAAL